MTDRNRPLRLLAAAALTALTAAAAQATEATQWRPHEESASASAAGEARATAGQDRTADFTDAERDTAIARANDSEDPIAHIAAVADEPDAGDRSPARPPAWEPAEAAADGAR